MLFRSWQGLLAPAGVARGVLAALNKETAAVVGSKDFSEAVNTQGAEADHIGGAAFAAFIRKDHAQWKGVIEKNKIRGD